MGAFLLLEHRDCCSVRLGPEGSQRRSMLLAVTNQTEQQPEGALGQVLRGLYMPTKEEYTKAVYYDLCKIQQAHTQAWTAGMPLMPTMKQAQEQVAAKKKKSVKECSWATGKRKKRP
ncbi:MAG: hypothetical protein FRX49_11184 [Trebouxia sp. A1-2]|nr:MAG: hypothetical protein FRX49_11184 [Trebouxia sp. A1-2]